MFHEDMIQAGKKGIPLYIWGSGEVGKLVSKKLQEMGIGHDGYITDDKGGVLTEGEPVAEGKSYGVIRGWLGALYMSDDVIIDRFPGCCAVFTVSDIYEPHVSEEITRNFYNQNQNEFERVREVLADELSRKTFDAFIASKISHSNDTLIPLVIPTQYFFEGAPWRYKGDDVLVDCGAFDGDSIRSFIALRGHQYKEIVAFEPDGANFSKLQKWITASGLPNIQAHNVGAYHEKTILSFASSEDMESYISEEGNVRIPVDTIDHVCGGKDVSIIKMDIEGSELDALKGAHDTIVKNKPILMISAYHKKDDLFVLQKHLDGLCGGYKFFLRAHKPIPIDTVLYAVPENRVK